MIADLPARVKRARQEIKMNDQHTRYLEALKARHAAELEPLRRALAGRRPGLLRVLRKHQAATERETARIFMAIDHREGSHENS